MDHALRIVYWGLMGLFAATGLVSIFSAIHSPMMLFPAFAELALAALFGYLAWRKETGLGMANRGSKLPEGTKSGFICKECGSINRRAEQIQEGGGRSVILFLLLCCFFIVPGLLYWGFKKPASRHRVCKACGSFDTLIPLTSPLGADLLQKWSPPETNL